MSALENKQKQAALTQLLAQTGSGLMAGTPQAAWGNSMAGMASNMGQAAAMQEQQEKAEKKRKGGTFGKIGSLLGGIGGTALGGPGLGAILGPALGSAIGGTAGQWAGSGELDLGSALGYGAQGALSGIMGKITPDILGGLGLGKGAGGAGAAASGAAGEAASAATSAPAAVAANMSGSTPAALSRAGTAPAMGAALSSPAAVSSTMAGSSMAAPAQGFLSKLLPAAQTYMNGQLGMGAVSGLTGFNPDAIFDTSQEGYAKFQRDPVTGQLIKTPGSMMTRRPIYGGLF